MTADELQAGYEREFPDLQSTRDSKGEDVLVDTPDARAMAKQFTAWGLSAKAAMAYAVGSVAGRRKDMEDYGTWRIDEVVRKKLAGTKEP